MPVFPKSIGTLVGPVLFAALVGCGNSGTLRVTKVAVSTQKPSNVALYLDVRDNGRPVAGLQEKDFKVYEDGKLVPAKKGKRALLDAEVTSANFAIVQVDLSGPIADSEHLPDLAQTVAHFAQDLNDRQEVAVNAFDGNDEVAPFIAFGAGKEQFKNLADGLRKFRPRTRNSNLYGAVYQGISALEEKLANSPLEEKQATLIVFTDRQDLSHTVGIEQMKEKLKGTSVQIYIIGAGETDRPAGPHDAGADRRVPVERSARISRRASRSSTRSWSASPTGATCCRSARPRRRGSTSWRSRSRPPAGRRRSRTSSTPPASTRADVRPRRKPLFEEIEALKADAAEKQKVIEAKEKEKEAAEAEAALAAIKDPGGKEKGDQDRREGAGEDRRQGAGEDRRKEPAKEMAKSAKEPAKAAPAPHRRQGTVPAGSPARRARGSQGRRSRPNRSSTRSNGPPGAPSPRCAARFPSSLDRLAGVAARTG